MNSLDYHSQTMAQVTFQQKIYIEVYCETQSTILANIKPSKQPFSNTWISWSPILPWRRMQLIL